MEQNISAFIGILVLFALFMYLMLNRRKAATGYYDETAGYEIVFPNKNWSQPVQSHIERFANGTPFSEAIFQYKDRLNSINVIFRAVGNITKQQNLPIETYVLNLLKEWRTNPRDIYGEYDKYDLFNLPFAGKEIIAINKEAFKKVEYGSIKGIELLREVELEFNKDILDKIKMDSIHRDRLKLTKERVIEFFVFFEFKGSLLCFLTLTNLTNETHSKPNELIYELLKNFRELPSKNSRDTYEIR